MIVFLPTLIHVVTYVFRSWSFFRRTSRRTLALKGLVVTGDLLAEAPTSCRPR